MKDDTKSNKKDVKPDAAKTAFACKLKAARERTGKSQPQFFQLIQNGNISPEEDLPIFDKSPLTKYISYNQYEIAKNFPPLPELRRLAFHCNVSADELLGMYDAKYFCRLIKKIYPTASITATDQPLTPDEWPNDTAHKLQIKVTTPAGREYFPSINILEAIRQKCWDNYQMVLTEQIASYLQQEMFRYEFNYNKEQLEFIKKLNFLALAETSKEPLIGMNETAAKVLENYQNGILNNKELYDGCFRCNMDSAIYFYLMTNINPVDNGSRLPALFKLYALKMNGSKTKIPYVSDETFNTALTILIQGSSLTKRLFNTDFSYFKDENPFNNEFCRFLLSRIKTFINGEGIQNGKPVLNDSIDMNKPEYNKTTYGNMKRLLLDKLVTEGKYFEDGEWKAFTDYRPAFLADDNMSLNAEEIKTKLNRELFGAKPAKPKAKQPPGPIKLTSKGDGHGGY